MAFMNSTPSTLERAFQLARSGECANPAEIRVRLKKERHDQVEAHLQGPSITKQLRSLCDEAARQNAERTEPAE
jgi:hypothetical protein